MRAGRLKHQITIKRPAETRTAQGDVVIVWQDVITVRAGCYPLAPKNMVAKESGKEYDDIHKKQFEVNYRVELRYLPDISPGWAVYFGEKILDIIIPLDPTEQKRDLQLFCIERQALGSE